MSSIFVRLYLFIPNLATDIATVAQSPALAFAVIYQAVQLAASYLVAVCPCKPIRRAKQAILSRGPITEASVAGRPEAAGCAHEYP